MAAKKAKRKTAKKAASKRKTVRKTAAKRKPARKTAKRKTAKKATRKVAKKATRKPAKKTARKTARKTTRKTTARKATKRVAKKAVSTEINVKKLSPIRKGFSKSQIVGTISEQVGISRKQAGAAMEVFHNIIHSHLNGCGEFKLPGLLKVVVVKKPARKARKGINPFTGEEMMFKAKPAHKVVKIRPLKNMKEMVK